MFRPVQMVKMNVLLLAKHMYPMTDALGELGVVHLIDATAQSTSHLLTDVERKDEVKDLASLEQRCSLLCDNLNIVCSEPPLVKRIPRARIETILAEVEDKMRAEEEAIRQLTGESGILRQHMQKLAEYPFREIPLSSVRDLSHLYLVTGRLSPALLPELRQQLHDRSIILHEPTAGGEERILLLTSRRNRWAVDSELSKSGFKPDQLATAAEDTPARELDKAQSRVDLIRLEIEQHQEKVGELGKEYGKLLCRIMRVLADELTVVRAQQHFGRAGELCCISGWIPHDQIETVQGTVARITGDTGVVELVLPEKDVFVQTGREKVPTLFKQNAIMRPFQKLVSGFGAPGYEDIEPSLFVALSFVLMFGIMFGDVGQGGVLALLGLYLLRSKRTGLLRFRDAGWLLIFCGLAAVIFGFLYGIIFGYEELLPAIWMSPLRNMMLMLKVTVVFGIVLISVSIIMNIINKIRHGDYFGGILDKFGIIGILFYWGSLGLGLKLLYTQSLSSAEIGILIVLPLAVLFLKEPLQALLQRKPRLLHSGILSYLLQASIDVMDTVTAFLGSTVSFVRVGAFALSHAALCLAIYAVVDLLRDVPAAGLWAFLVIVAGNALVIALEGMVSMIQGVRLEYYELFSKYFSGDGVFFTPFESTHKQD